MVLNFEFVGCLAVQVSQARAFDAGSESRCKYRDGNLLLRLRAILGKRANHTSRVAGLCCCRAQFDALALIGCEFVGEDRFQMLIAAFMTQLRGQIGFQAYASSNTGADILDGDGY